MTKSILNAVFMIVAPALLLVAYQMKPIFFEKHKRVGGWLLIAYMLLVGLATTFLPGCGRL